MNRLETEAHGPAQGPAQPRDHPFSHHHSEAMWLPLGIQAHQGWAIGWAHKLQLTAARHPLQHTLRPNRRTEAEPEQQECSPGAMTEAERHRPKGD